MRIFYAALLFFTVTSSADTVRYTNANIWGESSQTFLVHNGKFIKKPIGPVKDVNLKGAFVVPHLVDAHAHLLGLGRALETVDLVGTRSFEEVIERTRKNAPAKGWIVGRGWDQNDWADKRFPQHNKLSALFPNRPVLLKRVDGHVLIANKKAMELAGITKQSQQPPGGQIIRDAAGRLTGVFVDNAMAPIVRAQAQPTHSDRVRMLRAAFARCLEVGLTGVHDMGVDAATIDTFKALDRDNAIPIRVYAYTDGYLRGQRVFRGNRFWLIGAKLFADGALGSRGAALMEPYSDKPGSRGHLLLSEKQLTDLSKKVVAAGFQTAIHAIGDRGVHVALNALQKAGRGKLPNRIEHVQVVSSSDMSRFKSEGVVPSMQPTHCTSDMPWAERRLGKKRIQGAYAWRTLMKTGVRLVLGSDFPVESPEPLKGIYAAVTRTDVAGHPTGGWHPLERMTVDEAIMGFSVSATQSVGADQENADFTVFSKDLRKIPVDEIPKVSVLKVVVAGREVYKQH